MSDEIQDQQELATAPQTTDSSSEADPGRSEPDSDAPSDERPASPADSAEEIRFADGVSVPPALAEQAKELEKQFRERYLEKTRELAEQRKSWEAERTEALQARDIVNHLKRDPSLWDSYKQILGAGQSAEPPPPATFETVEQLQAYVRSQAQSTIQQYETTRQVTDAWKDAWQSAVASDPALDKYKTVIANELQNGQSKYLHGYRLGQEGEIIRRVGKDLREWAQSLFEAQKQDVIKQVKGKVDRSTERASESTGVGSAPANTREAILREMRETFGA